MSDRRVVVTGLGLVTPVGNTVDESWKNIKAGVSGVRTIEDFDASAFNTRFSASVRDFNYEDYFSKKEARKMDTFVHVKISRLQQDDVHMKRGERHRHPHNEHAGPASTTSPQKLSSGQIGRAAAKHRTKMPSSATV